MKPVGPFPVEHLVDDLTEDDLRRLEPSRKAARQMLAEAAQRLHQHEEAARLGVHPLELRAAMAVAAETWAGRAPWRFLPAWLRWAAFPWVGRRFVGRFVTRWIDSAHSARNIEEAIDA